MLCALMMVGCGGRGNSKATAFQPHHFPSMPEPPAVITEPKEATEYVLSNYWNEFLAKAYPCDSGIVNGVPAEVEKVDNGLMAVAAPAGHSEIVFTYHTAGLRQSVAVSAGAIVVYAVWVAVLHRKKRREESSVG